MKRAQQRARRDVVVVSLIGVWFLLAAVLFTWFGIQNHSYKKEWQSYAAVIQHKLVVVQETFRNHAAVADQTITQQALTAFADDLADTRPPHTPTLFGLALGAESERAQQARTAEYIAALQINLRTTAAFMEYQQKVATELQALSLVSAGSDLRIVALAQKWQQAAVTVANIAPPEVLGATHTALGQYMQDAQKTILTLADLYKAGDEPGFKAQYEQLQGVVARLRALNNDVATIASSLDTERARLGALLAQDLN